MFPMPNLLKSHPAGRAFTRPVDVVALRSILAGTDIPTVVTEPVGGTLLVATISRVAVLAVARSGLAVAHVGVGLHAVAAATTSFAVTP